MNGVAGVKPLPYKSRLLANGFFSNTLQQNAIHQRYIVSRAVRGITSPETGVFLREEQFEALYADCSSMVYWTAYGLTNNHHTSLELTQTVFLKAFVRWDTLHALASPQARSWLYRAVKNAAIDCLRRERHEWMADCVPERADTDICSLPEAACMQNETSKTVWAEVQALPRVYREAVVLYYFADFSQKEAADALRVSGGTYRSRLSRAREILSSVLGKEEAF